MEDSVTFFPPSNQLALLDPSSAEANGGNTFNVAEHSPHKQRPQLRPQPPSIDDFARLLDDRLDRFATKSDFQGVIKQVNENTALITSNREEIRALKTDISELKEATGRAGVRNIVESVIKETSAGRQVGERPLFKAGAKCKEQEASRIKKYNMSRASLRIWPIPGSNPTEISNSLKDFLSKSLSIKKEDIGCLGIRWVERTRIPPRSKINNEVRVTFTSQYYRDELASKGRQLAGHIDNTGASTAGFRLDIPDFLSSDFKVLNDYGYLMKRTHGKDTRKYIKYDDEEFGLYLELKLPDAGGYLRINPDLARSLMAESERFEIDRRRKDLLARPVPPAASYQARTLSPLDKPHTTDLTTDLLSPTGHLSRCLFRYPPEIVQVVSQVPMRIGDPVLPERCQILNDAPRPTHRRLPPHEHLQTMMKF